MKDRLRPAAHRDRARRRPAADNPERWLVSYADFITLLLAFFVVMYAASANKTETLPAPTTALRVAFGNAPMAAPVALPAKPAPEPVLTPLSRPRPLPPPRAAVGAAAAGPLPPPRAAAADAVADAVTPPPRPDPSLELARRLRQQLSELVKTQLVRVRPAGNRVEIEIRDQVLFGSGSAELEQQTAATATRIAAVLSPLRYAVRVEGHTDNMPIENGLYPSNWELSAARAARLVRLLIEAGLAPSRLTAVGYGEFKPIADNRTAEGRARNRRVVLVVTPAAAGPAAAVGRVSRAAPRRAGSAADG